MSDSAHVAHVRTVPILKLDMMNERVTKIGRYEIREEIGDNDSRVTHFDPKPGTRPEEIPLDRLTDQQIEFFKEHFPEIYARFPPAQGT